MGLILTVGNFPARMAESNCDRLSGMPDEILHHILSYLPTLDSVCSSVLSRRWRHLWRCVPAFHFDINNPSNLGKMYCSKSVFCEAGEKIDDFIARRDGACPLRRFHLHINCAFYYHRAEPIIDWINYARSHGVQDVSVHTLNLSKPLPLFTFFELSSVEALDLQQMYHYYPVPSMLPEYVVPSKMKWLTLVSPRLSFPDQCLAALPFTCPHLQELTLSRGVFEKVVDITASNLRRLRIGSNYSCCGRSYEVRIICPRLEYLCLSCWGLLERFHGQMPSLREASILLIHSNTHLTQQFAQIAVSLRNVTKLSLRLKPSFEVKGCLPEHTTPFPIFSNLKNFKLIADIGGAYTKHVLLCFLLHSPNLSSLDVIHEDQGYPPITSMAGEQQPEIQASLKASDHLKKVSVTGINNEEKQSELLEMLSKLVNEWEKVVVIT